MKVSVIIPFHKELTLLADCLQSLEEQRVEEMEVIMSYKPANNFSISGSGTGLLNQ